MGTPNRQVSIVTDTTACLPMEFAVRHSVESVPQVIRFGSESFLEEVDITYAQFVTRLRTSTVLPSTAAPLVGDFVKAYERQLARSRAILSLHPSEQVSGTVRSALTARDTAFPGGYSRVIDTRTVAGNLASMVLAAVEWAEAGIGADEILRRIQSWIPRGRTYFVVATLEYLQKGGRVGGASALGGRGLPSWPASSRRRSVSPMSRSTLQAPPSRRMPAPAPSPSVSSPRMGQRDRDMRVFPDLLRRET